MNVEASIVLFDYIANRKKILDERIELCRECLDIMIGNERKEAQANLDCYLDESLFLTKFQLDFMRALYNGGK